MVIKSHIAYQSNRRAVFGVSREPGALLWPTVIAPPLLFSSLCPFRFRLFRYPAGEKGALAGRCHPLTNVGK